MKKLGLTTAMAFFFSMMVSFAQEAPKFEVKLKPLSLISGNVEGMFEYLKSDKVGFELGLGYADGTRTYSSIDYDRQTYDVTGMAKYYLKPKTTADRFYLGAYANYARTNYEESIDGVNGFVNNKVNAGLYLGYKKVAKSGLFFEAGAGLGRSVMNENVATSGSNVDLSTISTQGGLHMPTRLAIGLRF